MGHHFAATIQSLIDAQDNPFVLIDNQYRIVAANSAYRAAYGLARGDLIGRHCYEVSHHRDGPCHLHGEDCPHQQVFSSGRTHEVLHIHYDHAERPEKVRILGHSIPGPDGEPLLGESIHRLAPEEVTAGAGRMIGGSKAFLRSVEQLSRAAVTRASILIEGESGVGKELAARFVHAQSPRRKAGFMSVDCTTLTETLIEAELFGHEAGAFTGCIGRKAGLVERADGGTLFLDEIGDLPVSVQPKLLRLLESGEFRRVGGRETLSVDVRVVAATNLNLRERVRAGAFRQDLYYRLACIAVRLPPLRDRREDVPALAEALLAQISAQNGRRSALSRAALDCLGKYDFPGNVRELRNILQRASAMSRGDTITSTDLNLCPDPTPVPGASSADGTTALPLKELEHQHIAALIEKHHGHRRRIATELGISERTLYRKLRRFGLG